MTKDLSTIGERLNFARKQANLTYTQLAEKIGGGVLGSALSTAFLRNTVKEYYKVRIIEILGLNPVWVENGLGEMYSDKKGSKRNIITEVKQVPFEEFTEAKYLPVTAQAGYLSSLEGATGIELQTILVPKEFDKGEYAVIEITGPSMDDGTSRAICDGDKLLAKVWDYSTKQLPYRQFLFVIVSKEGIVCKQVTKHDVETGAINCHSFNPIYPDYEINVRDILRLFIVKKIVERRINF